MPKVSQSRTTPALNVPKTPAAATPAKPAATTPATTGWGPAGTQSASASAKAKLTAAAPGGITGEELKATFAALSAEFGPQAAADALKENFGAHLPEFTADSLAWVQKNFASMEGHVDRYQQVLGSFLQDAQLLDANFNGKLDAGDIAFTKKADGTVNTQALGQALADRVKINGAIVNACELLAKANHKYSTLPFQSFNREMWQGTGVAGLGSVGGVFKLKDGVKPSDAVNDIFNNPKKYKFECATALVIAYHKAILDLIGPKDFDANFKDLKMGPWKYSDTFKQYWGTVNSGKPFQVGQYGYIKNSQVDAISWCKGWQGENVISLGGDKYYGHMYGITTGQKMIEAMNKHRNVWAKHSAAMTDVRGDISASVLKLDKTPE